MWSSTSTRASKRRSLVTSREPLTRGARSTTRGGTFSGWLAPRSARNSPRTCEAIFAAPEKEMALGVASSVAEKWRGKGREKVAEHIEEHVEEECLSLVPVAFPESHRRRILTTNGQERFNQEIKRRTRVVRIFPNRESCLRLVTALAIEQSEEWVTRRRYLEMREIEEYLSARSGKWRGRCSWSDRGGTGLGGDYRNFGT